MPVRGTRLIVQDSPEAAERLAELVGQEGFTARVCGSAREAFEAYAGSRPIAVFLDWVLPDRPGLEVCRQMRGDDPVLPIIFISDRGDEASVTRGLDAGADDFMVRPFRQTELIARLEAHVRKAEAARDAAGDPADFQFGAVRLDPAARVVTVQGSDVALGQLEFRLLEYFCRNAGIAVSREQILNEVYGYEADISTERVDLLVRRLRSKLGEGADRGSQLVAVPGYGYRLERRSDRRSPERAW